MQRWDFKSERTLRPRLLVQYVVANQGCSKDEATRALGFVCGSYLTRALVEQGLITYDRTEGYEATKMGKEMVKQMVKPTKEELASAASTPKRMAKYRKGGKANGRRV
jgi:hypothetical protein